jgi:hypothetical protein
MSSHVTVAGMGIKERDLRELGACDLERGLPASLFSHDVFVECQWRLP